MRIFYKKAFTLVELLIVIGIIGLLAVTLLVTLNPAEAQRKARDAKRIKDASTLQAIVEQIISDGITVTGGMATAAGAISTTNAGSTNCAVGGWLAMDVCTYAKTVPVDPQNGNTVTVVTGAAATGARVADYRIRVNAGNYEINVRQESLSNAKKITGDGGLSAEWVEIFSGQANLLP